MKFLHKAKSERNSKDIEDILLRPTKDRRLLANVPDKEGIRTNVNRRGKHVLENGDNDVSQYMKSNNYGIRYQASYQTEIICWLDNGEKAKFSSRSSDISTTGILLNIENQSLLDVLTSAQKIRLKFEITPGSMPEGYEMKVKLEGKMVRFQKASDNTFLCGLEFVETLAQYANRKKGRYVLMMSSLVLFFTSLLIVLMRTESIIYFEFYKYLYLYSIVTATFLLSRYLFGALYRPMTINPDFTPGVTIIIPCFNEEEWIARTINSCINQDYPVDKLEVIVIDDCSTDNSVEVIKNTIETIHLGAERLKTIERLRYVVQEKNAGKREALARGTKMAKHELIVFVDSDSFLDPFAIKNLVQPFQDPKMGGVSGRTDVANTYTNTLTKMQSVRYYIAFRINKAAEAFFDAVTCLSGPLSCYRKEIVLDNMDQWLNQRFLGQKATFGDDRSLTNLVLKKHRTGYQDSAVCSTIVPNTYSNFMKQQMRWKRSWLRESIIGGRFMWKKEPLMSLFFYMGFIVPAAAPIIFIYNLIYIPLFHRTFPSTYLIGLLLMSLLMSFTQLLYRKSSTWLFGILFCLYYEVFLLWQMPIAWVTFWKTTWGTRMTPEDIKERNRREEKKRRKFKKSIEVKDEKNRNI
ncbi:glycosyltransferase family 2 protein [Desulfosporosinus sp. SYSU MS00001]|uniref:glycosyltransferase family 2 protein n=1 Tax=Desulfosporosinus sp. SYSU MS00001 TaxID=3416284 RepID=UPI003CF1626B